MSEGTKSTFGQKIRSGKIAEIAIVVLLLVVVAALLLSSFSEKETGAQGYAQETQARLAKVLSRIEDAGDVEVFLTVASDGEKVIATECVESADGTVTTSPVFSGGEPVILEELMPEITGVLIVAEGADDLGVRFNLIEATASVLNINQSIIKVYTMGE